MGYRARKRAAMRVCCCASKITIALEAARSSKRRCSKISRGSGSWPMEQPTRQSERGAVYERALDDLRQRGLTYACECSRSDVGASRYPGTCRDKHLTRVQPAPVSG